MNSEFAHNAPPHPLPAPAALAWGARAAGVRVVTGYPGAPATGVFDALLQAPELADAHVRWAPNEKVALELAYGASLGGARALVVLKSVGLNIALDPLACMSYSGCQAGLVILVGDDPGGWGSQNEQDSRWLARVAEVPVVEPLAVEQCAALMAQAFAWSEGLGTPIILRTTSALMASHGAPETPFELPQAPLGFVHQRNRWVVLPASVIKQRRAVHRRFRSLQDSWEISPFDMREGHGPLGVLAVGATYSKLRGLLAGREPQLNTFGLSSVYPLPEGHLARWMATLERALILEECSPFVEQAVRALVQQRELSVRILGRADATVPEEGELGESELAAALTALDPAFGLVASSRAQRAMPSRVPLCEDCLYRPTVDALLRAMERHGGRRNHIVVGETGCMVRANLPPWELFDVKYSLGSGLGLAMGLALGGTKQRVVALLGDSSTFHSDLNALPHAAQLGLPITVLILDNGTTALTGGQSHPGSPRDEHGQPRSSTDLAGIVRAAGLEVATCAPQEAALFEQALDRALTSQSTSVLIVRAPCAKHVSAEEFTA